MAQAPAERDLIYTKLNMETAQIPWRELQRYFASGTVITVHDGIDMIEVAVRMALDDTQEISRMLCAGEIEKVTDQQANTWHDNDVELWTVVVKPWILVQVEKGTSGTQALLS